MKQMLFISGVKFQQNNMNDGRNQFQDWEVKYTGSNILKLIWNMDFWVNTKFLGGLYRAKQLGSGHGKKKLSPVPQNMSTKFLNVSSIMASNIVFPGRMKMKKVKMRNI